MKLYAAAARPSFVLMGNNARPHRDAIVDDFLESEKIAHIKWSTYSKDLNPTENLWDAHGCVLHVAVYHS